MISRAQQLAPLLESLERVFPVSDRPSVWPLPSNTSSYIGDEAHQIAQHFSGVDWNALTPSFLLASDGGEGSCLAFLCKEAVRYYLPGFMAVVATDPRSVDTYGMILLQMLYPLTVKKNSFDREYFERWLGQLNLEQELAIKQFLLFIKEWNAFEFDLDTIERALAFWEGRLSTVPNNAV